MDREETRALLEAPSAAVLAVYRADGTILMTPVWFRADDEWIEIVIAEGDAKLERLRADPRCVFMAFETTPPFRGLRIEVEAALNPDGVRSARLAIGVSLCFARKARWVFNCMRPSAGRRAASARSAKISGPLYC